MDKKSIKRSLKYSIFDGAFYSMMVGFGESFFMAFGVFLKANIFEQGMLGALPQASGYFFELFSDRILRIVKSRKRMVVAGAILQGLMYIPIMLIFLFGQAKIIFLVLFVALYWIVGMIISPAWNSWMGDLVEVNSRGRYFGMRNKIAGIASFVAYLLGGLILQQAAGDYQYAGYIIIFGLALVSRLISVFNLMRQDEPSYEISPQRYKFREFIKDLFKTNFGNFTVYMFAMNLSVQVAAPFFTPFMLKELGFSYLDFTLVTAVAMITKFMLMPSWGKLIDRYGAKSVLSMTGYIIPIIPILWLFNHNLFYLFLIQIVSGFLWSGFELASINFMFDNTHYEKRSAMIAYYNVLYGISTLLGALIGTYVAANPVFLRSGYLMVFAVSGCLRLILPLIFKSNLREERDVPKVGYEKLFFKILTIRPTRGVIFNIIPIPRRLHKKGLLKKVFNRKKKSKKN